MTDKVITATPQEGIRNAYFRLREAGIRHLPVLDGAQLVGMLSDRDLRRPDWVDEAPDLSHPYQLDDNLTVADLMNHNPAVIHTYDHLLKATELILKRDYGALPVLDKGNHLVGMLSKGDLIQALHDRLLNESMHGRM